MHRASYTTGTRPSAHQRPTSGGRLLLCRVQCVLHKSWGAPATCLRPRLSCMCGWRSRGQGGALATWHALLQRLWISQGSPQRRHGTPTLRHLLNKGGETPPDETETDSKVQDSKVRKSIPQRNAGTRMVGENTLQGWNDVCCFKTCFPDSTWAR